METVVRRYFVAQGPEAEALIEKITADREAFVQKVKALQDKYNASAVFVTDSRYVTCLGFPDATPRTGFIIESHRHGGPSGHHLAKPDRRTKIGRQAAEEIAAARADESPSDTLVDHYGAYRLIAHGDGASRTGLSLANSVGWIAPDRKTITLDVPVSESEPYDPPAGLSEIKKSEYVALTEA